MDRLRSLQQKLCNWVEEIIEETLSFYRLPLQHHKHLKSSNMLERLNEEIKWRTLVVRIFPSEASCLRLIRVSRDGNSRELDRSHALLKHESAEGTPKGEASQEHSVITEKGCGKLRELMEKLKNSFPTAP